MRFSFHFTDDLAATTRKNKTNGISIKKTTTKSFLTHRIQDISFQEETWCITDKAFNLWRPLYSCHTGTATCIKRPVPDRVKPSFVIFDIRALIVRVPGCKKNYKRRHNPVWRRMLYSCTQHIAKVSVKGLRRIFDISRYQSDTVRSPTPGDVQWLWGRFPTK